MNVLFDVATVDAYGEPCPSCQKFSSNGYADWYVLGDAVAVVDVQPPLAPPLAAVPEPEIIGSLALGIAALWLRRRSA